MKVYEDFKVYGPYLRKDKRKHVCLVKYEKGKKIKKTVSYPKFLMEQHLNRYLLEDETVDHINGNFEDDRIENLQILTRSENANKASVYVEVPIVSCIWCRTEFKPSRAQYEKRGVTRAGPFCSRSCSGKYGKSVQETGITLDREKVEVLHYSYNNNYKKEYVNFYNKESLCEPEMQ